MKSYSESSSSSSIVKKTYSADLHDFKMNLMKTLNSEYMTKFNDNNSKLKRFKKNIPRIPVKVIPNNYYSTNNNNNNNNNSSESEEEEDILIKSKLNSPFLFRKSITSIDYCVSLKDSISSLSVGGSSSISQADSGLSSVDSTQLFISDLKECLNVFKTSNNQTTTTDTLSTDECNLILIQLMNKVGNGSLIK